MEALSKDPTGRNPLIFFRYFIIIGSVAFIIIIGIALILVYKNAGLMRDRINNDFNQQQLVLAHQAASQIDDELHVIEAELNSLEWMLRKPIITPVLGDIMKSMAERTKSRGVSAIGFMDERDNIREYCGYNCSRDLSTEQKIKEFCANASFLKVTLSPFQVISNHPAGEKIICLLSKRVRLSDNKDGLIYAEIIVQNLISNVTKRIRSGETGYAWVIDKNGMFLYHPENDFIGKNAFTARQEKEPYISFAKINEIMKNQMLEGKEGTGVYESGWHRGVEGYITKLISFSPIETSLLSENSLWSVAVAAPTTEVAEAVDEVYSRHLTAEALIIASIIVFGLLSFYYQRRISKSLQQQVSEQEKYISSILQNTVDAIIIIDIHDRVREWNKGAEMVFGYTEEEMMGRTFHRLVPVEIEAEEELQRITKTVLNEGHIRHYRTKRKTKDGRRITIDLSRTLIQDDNGKAVGSIAIIKDVTDSVELEQRIYGTEKLASIGTLAAGVAHEINNPLAVILGFVDLLLEKFEEGSQDWEDLKLIEENANNAKKIVEDLLGFARVTEGTDEIIDVNQSIVTIDNIVKNTLVTKKTDFVIDVQQKLPLVRGDSREFQQVLFNLINNATAAMEPYGGTLTIKASSDVKWVHTEVCDTGSGIPEKIKSQIFDPFFTTKKADKGTGLGLSLCYGIIKKYGGKMHFESVSADDNPHLPSGTTFTVSMPIWNAEEPSEGGKIESKNISD
ncbi:MAG: PAS domain S-box protein [candidate division Zixibacteria bacterium]|nr:PAS domain S-box protein [candidate division Zixibacteria bacterium]